MKNRVYNLTTTFALPLLGWSRSNYQPYLINAYVKHEHVDHFTENHIFVLLKWSDDEKFKELEKVLTDHKTHVSTYEPDDKGNYVIHVFKVGERMLPDYKSFLSGKYSRMSPRAKKLIMISSKIGGVTSKILEKDSSLKEVQEAKMGVFLSDEDEVWPCIDDMSIYHKEVFHETVLDEIK